MRRHCFARHLEDGNCLFALNCRKVLQEIVEPFTRLEVVEENLDRHTCFRKDRRSGKNVGIGLHNLVIGNHADAMRKYPLRMSV